MASDHEPDERAQTRQRIESRIAYFERRLGNLEDSLWRAERELRELLPDTRAARSRLGFYKSLMVTQCFYRRELTELHDMRWDLDDPDE